RNLLRSKRWLFTVVSAARPDEVILHKVKETDRVTSMTTPTPTEQQAQPNPGGFFAGVDTHKATHQVAVIDHHGHLVAERGFATTAAGCEAIRSWLAQWPLSRVGVEQ